MRTFAEFQTMGRVGKVKEVGSTLRVSIAAEYGRKDNDGEFQTNPYWERSDDLQRERHQVGERQRGPRRPGSRARDDPPDPMGKQQRRHRIRDHDGSRRLRQHDPLGSQVDGTQQRITSKGRAAWPAPLLVFAKVRRFLSQRHNEIIGGCQVHLTSGECSDNKGDTQGHHVGRKHKTHDQKQPPIPLRKRASV